MYYDAWTAHVNIRVMSVVGSSVHVKSRSMSRVGSCQELSHVKSGVMSRVGWCQERCHVKSQVMSGDGSCQESGHERLGTLEGRAWDYVWMWMNHEMSVTRQLYGVSFHLPTPVEKWLDAFFFSLDVLGDWNKFEGSQDWVVKSRGWQKTWKNS